MLNILPLDIPAVVAAKRPKDLLRDSLAVLNSVRPGYYAVIIGPCVQGLIYGTPPGTGLTASTVVTNDVQLHGEDSFGTIGANGFYERLTLKRVGVNILLCHLSFADMLKAIPNKENHLHIRPNGLWYYDEN